MGSFRVVADFDLGGAKADTNLAGMFTPAAAGVWELALATPVTRLPSGRLTVSVKDRQGNETRVERTFSVAEEGRHPGP